MYDMVVDTASHPSQLWGRLARENPSFGHPGSGLHGVLKMPMQVNGSVGIGDSGICLAVLLSVLL